MNDLGDKIKKLRTERQMTQIDLAKKLNMANTTISNWENGYRMPSLSDLRRLASFFQVPLSHFEMHDASKRSELIDDLDIRNQIIEFKSLVPLLKRQDHIVFGSSVFLLLLGAFIRLPITFGLISIALFLNFYLLWEYVRKQYVRKRTTHKKIMVHVRHKVYYIHGASKESIRTCKKRMRLMTLVGLGMSIVFSVNVSLLIFVLEFQIASMLFAVFMLLLVVAVLGVYRFFDGDMACTAEIDYHQAIRDLRQPFLFAYLFMAVFSLFVFVFLVSYRIDLYELDALVLSTSLIAAMNTVISYYTFAQYHHFVLGYVLHARNDDGVEVLLKP